MAPTPTRALIRLLASIPDAPDEVSRMAPEITDWHALLDAASRHGVLRVVFDALRRAGATIPSDVHRRAEEIVTIQTLESELSIRALRRCLDAFEAAGVRAGVLKGPLLAERLYGSRDARPSVDIDLLVDEDEVDAAIATLAAVGYRPDAPDRVRYYRRNHHHVQLFHDAYPIVELHFAAYAGFGVSLSARPLLARSEPWVTEDLRARVLSAKDELVTLAVHGAGHRYARLMWLYDLKLLARAHPSLTVTEVLEHARSLRVRRAVGASLFELRRVLGSEVGDHRGARLVDPLSRLAVPLLVPTGHVDGVPALDAALNVACASLLCDSPQLAIANLAKKVTRDLPERLRRSRRS